MKDHALRDHRSGGRGSWPLWGRFDRYENCRLGQLLLDQQPDGRFGFFRVGGRPPSASFSSLFYFFVVVDVVVTVGRYVATVRRSLLRLPWLLLMAYGIRCCALLPLLV
jgi:hypothetical protein